MTQTILIVDDDSSIVELVENFLTQYNYAVLSANNGTQALEILQQGKSIDLVVMDIMMKGLDGMSVCKQIRANPAIQNIPIILLTAMADDQDRILGLELGADDYLTKPFNSRELLARIRAVLRRVESYSERLSVTVKDRVPVYQFAQWKLDTGTRSLYSPEGVEVSITAKLYLLLLAFLERPQRVVNRDQLMDVLNNRDCDPFDRSIDILVSRLRQKLEEDPKNPKLIKTVRAGGYMFATTVTLSS